MQPKMTHIWEDFCRDIHHVFVCASVEGLGKNRYHKHVDEEGHKQRDGRLDEEVFVGLSYFFLVRAVHLSRLRKHLEI